MIIDKLNRKTFDLNGIVVAFMLYDKKKLYNLSQECHNYRTINALKSNIKKSYEILILKPIDIFISLF